MGCVLEFSGSILNTKYRDVEGAVRAFFAPCSFLFYIVKYHIESWSKHLLFPSVTTSFLRYMPFNEERRPINLGGTSISVSLALVLDEARIQRLNRENARKRDQAAIKLQT